MEKGQSLQPGKILSPPETLEVLKDLGFNLLALSNNHAFELKVSGIQNTLQEVSRLGLVHAGMSCASKPGKRTRKMRNDSSKYPRCRQTGRPRDRRRVT